MATFVEVVNKVLVRLRENEVTNSTDTVYSKLVSAFINDTLSEHCAAWNWNSLRSDVTVATVASQSDYAITGTNEESQILAVYDDTSDIKVHRFPHEKMSFLTYFADMPVQSPYWYREVGTDASNVRLVRLYPTPATIYSMVYSVYIPQIDVSVDSTQIKIPVQPLVYATWVKAVSERGEDGGLPYAELDARAHRKLQDAIILDQERYTDVEKDWRAV